MILFTSYPFTWTLRQWNAGSRGRPTLNMLSQYASVSRRLGGDA